MSLKKFRKQNTISQQTLAEYLGVCQSFISQIERGISPLPEAALEKIKDYPDWNSTSITLEDSDGVNLAQSEATKHKEKNKLIPIEVGSASLKPCFRIYFRYVSIRTNTTGSSLLGMQGQG